MALTAREMKVNVIPNGHYLLPIKYVKYVLNLFHRKEKAMISPVRKRKLNMARLIDPDKETLCS